jgi:hypothetical protein
MVLFCSHGKGTSWDTIAHTTTTLPALADRAQRYDGWTPDRQRAFL